MPTYLDRILAAHRRAAAEDRRPIEHLVQRARQCPPTRGFAAALASGPGLSVIAEIKRRSPSKGELRIDLDPEATAKAYEAGGAACLSVLTDVEFFGGSPEDLRAARQAVSVPVLRKDFTVSAADVCDARLMGADCVLLIAAALDDAELAHLAGLATDIGIDVLVECHDEQDIEHAVALGASLVGINQRDLVTFEVDHERAVRLAALVPAGVVRVAESGVRHAADAKALADAGFDAILVGETLVVSPDPANTIRQLKGET
jgi:indole-3-glycerol phosphate synthase